MNTILTLQEAPESTTTPQPDIILRSVSDSMIFGLYSGDDYDSLEALQARLLYPLARYIAELARQEFGLDSNEEENGL